MQAFGHFRLVHRSAFRTWLAAPAWCRSAAALAAVRRRLAACDGILAVTMNPATGSVEVRHDPAFSWGTVGPAAWRLDGFSAPDPAPNPGAPMPAPSMRAAAPSLARIVDDLVALAIEGMIARRPANAIVQDMARRLLATALVEPDRA